MNFDILIETVIKIIQIIIIKLISFMALYLWTYNINNMAFVIDGVSTTFFIFCYFFA